MKPSSSDRSKARSAECRVRLASGAVRHRSAVCLTNQIPVLICRDRTGSTADFVLDKADKEHIGAALKLILAKDAILCTDSGKVLDAAARGMGITHRPVNLAAGVRVIAGVYHVQTSMPTIADSRNGCAVSTVSPHITWPTISAGEDLLSVLMKPYHPAQFCSPLWK